jgi:hypothetical protein
VPTDVIIDPTSGQIYWNDSAGSPQSISIKGDAQNEIAVVGYSASFSPGSSPAGAATLAKFNDNSGTSLLVPGTNGFDLGSATLRWNLYATNANLTGTLVVADSTISNSLITGSARFNGGIAISGNASVGQSLNLYGAGTAYTSYTGFRAGSATTSTLYTLPLTYPAAVGSSFLSSGLDGTMAWVAPPSGSGSGLATTATNVQINTLGNPNSFHPVLMTPVQVSSGSAVSANGTVVYNPSTDILYTPGLAVTSGVDSTNTTSGAFQVRGGLGVTGTGYFDVVRTRAIVTTGDVTIAGNLAVNGTTIDLGNAITDQVTFTGRVSSALLPISDNLYDLGLNSLGWRNFRVSGVGTVVTTNTTLIRVTDNSLANYSGFKFTGSGQTVYTLPSTSPTAIGASYLSSAIDGTMAWVAAPTSGGGTPGGSSKQIQYNNSSTFGGAAGFEYTTGGIAVTVSVFAPSGTGYTSGLWINSINGSTTRVGIGLSNPQFELEINGEISATNKSFVIDHPTKNGMKLRYGSLEGPENGVYVRGILIGENVIETPDYWLGLVDPDTFTVNLTPIGKYAQLYVEKVEDYKVYVQTTSAYPIHCFYTIWAERKDIPKLVTEY